MTIYEMEVPTRLTRKDIMDLMVATQFCFQKSDEEKWCDLHDKLFNVLMDYDEKHGI